MKPNLKFVSLKDKIIKIGLFASILPVILLIIVIVIQKINITDNVSGKFREQIEKNLENIAKDVYNLCQTQQEFITKVVDANLKTLDQFVKTAGTVTLNTGETALWNVIDPATKEAKSVMLPKMLFGGKWLGQPDVKIKMPLVDDIKDIAGCQSSIFQRANENGDMIRIATSVITKEGTRALGTLIPAKNADGSDNPIIKTVLNGNTYIGRAWVVDSWYVAGYAPFKNEKGEIIGLYAVGIKQESVESLRKGIMSTKIGKSGYVAIIGTKGTERGKYIISKDGERDGEIIIDTKDANGRPIIQEMVGFTSEMKGNAIKPYKYYWQNKGENEARLKMVALAYFEPWDWLINVGVYEDEFIAETISDINFSMNKLAFYIIFFGFVSLIIAALFFIKFLNKQVSEPIAGICNVANKLSEGNIDVKLEIDNDISEINNLLQSMSGLSMAIKNIVTDTTAMVNYAVDGKIDMRADTSIHKGEFRKITELTNNLMGSIQKPIDDFMRVLGRISLYDLTVDIKNEYPGIWNDMKKSILEIKSRMLRMTEVVVNISEGDMKDLEILRKVGKRSEQDIVIPTYIKMIEAIKAIVSDIEILTKAIKDGDLSVRADAKKHHGEYSKIILGINQMFDAIIKPINDTAKHLKLMSNSEFNFQMTGDYKGDYAILKNSINETVSSINQTLNQVKLVVDNVNSGSSQVAAASQSLSQASTEAASSLEEISASMQQISAQAKHNNENATAANGVLSTAKTAVEHGNSQMKEMVAAMNAINESARNISKIIKAIDEIAFQTNLLALNAAVEAARAGKHGKGFTVVAEEVRNLAQRSAKAAKETAEMIEDSINKTESGTAIAGSTAKILDSIVSEVVKSTDLMGEIASASKEQMQGIIQINQGLSQLDKVTQQNTATSEEAAATAEELSSHSAELKGMINQFKLDETKKRSDELKLIE